MQLDLWYWLVLFSPFVDKHWPWNSWHHESQHARPVALLLRPRAAQDLHAHGQRLLPSLPALTGLQGSREPSQTSHQSRQTASTGEGGLKSCSLTMDGSEHRDRHWRRGVRGVSCRCPRHEAKKGNQRWMPSSGMSCGIQVKEWQSHRRARERRRALLFVLGAKRLWSRCPSVKVVHCLWKGVHDFVFICIYLPVFCLHFYKK